MTHRAASNSRNCKRERESTELHFARLTRVTGPATQVTQRISAQVEMRGGVLGANGGAVFGERAGLEGAVSSNLDAATLVIACCSARKRGAKDLVPLVSQGDDIETVASRWLQTLRHAELLMEARDLYVGRGFRFIRTCADRHGSGLAVISAGLGLVEGKRRVPSYDLSPDAGDNALARRVQGWSPRVWWKAVSAGPFSSDLPAVIEPRPLTMVALTATYARLIAADLERSAAVADRVRIFGRNLQRHLPAAFHLSIMPYDDRLDVVGRRGTMGDFAARALEDFADSVGVAGPPQVDAERVRARLSTVERPARSVRQREDDATITSRVASWRRSEPGVSRSALLRRLRNTEDVACSEERLRRVLEALG